MPKFRFFIIFLIMVGYVLSGCATQVHKTHSKSPEVIYRDYPPEKPAPLPGEPVDKPETPERPKDEPSAERHQALPTRIGPEDVKPNADTSEKQLLAAVASLEAQAEDLLAQGQTDRAFTTAERAIRFDPGNPNIWNLLARIQLRRGNFSQAEQLSRKSNLLAKNNHKLQSGNWRIIAEALGRSGRAAEAENALRKARELE